MSSPSRPGSAGALPALYPAVKRTVDVVAAVLGLVVLMPVMLVVALLVRVKLGSPVLFRQTRPGRNGKPFELVKFRSMRDGDGSDAERLTSFGRKLRATSLDELPELWNVLKGEMSLVGPRPLRMRYLPLYNSHQARRHEVRPGITGLAQVNGRNALNWEDRFDLDVTYVASLSAAADLRIVLATVGDVVRRKGISQDGAATMTAFTGSPEVNLDGFRPGRSEVELIVLPDDQSDYEPVIVLSDPDRRGLPHSAEVVFD